MASARRPGTRQLARSSHARGERPPGIRAAQGGWPDWSKWPWPSGLSRGVSSPPTTESHAAIARVSSDCGPDVGVPWSAQAERWKPRITASRANWPGRVHLERGTASIWSGGRDSNPRHPAWKASALPSELPPPTGLDAGRLHPDRATSYPAPDPSTLIVPNRDSGILPLPACAVSVTILAARWVCAFQWSAKPSFQWVGHA